MQPDLAAAALAGLAMRRVLAVAVVREGRIAWASPALLAMFGLEAVGTEAGEARFLDLVAPADREALAGALQEKPGTEVGPRSFTGLRADGSQFDAELSGCTLELPGGPGVAIALSDVTVQRRAQAQLSYLALRDPLTELPNRALFFDRLRQALVARAAPRQLVRGAGERPGRVQADQRPLRARNGRCAAAGGGQAPARGHARGRHGGAGSGATSFPPCSRARPRPRTRRSWRGAWCRRWISRS